MCIAVAGVVQVEIKECISTSKLKLNVSVSCILTDDVKEASHLLDKGALNAIC